MSLSGSQRTALVAVVARLIPGDDSSPGAVQAGVPDFVENQLAEYFPDAAGDVARSLDGLDDAARAAGAGSFPELRAERQDELLRAVEDRPFFELLLQLTVDGFLCDPVHGGNRDLTGWRLIGYPGVTMAPSAAEQAIGAPIPFHGTTLADWRSGRRAAR